MGQLVISREVSTTEQINISTLSAGLYVVEIETLSGRFSQKFVKQ